jgi:hypothetical protein
MRKNPGPDPREPGDAQTGSSPTIQQLQQGASIYDFVMVEEGQLVDDDVMLDRSCSRRPRPPSPVTLSWASRATVCATAGRPRR